MLKKIATLAAFAAGFGLATASANATTVAGRVTSVAPTSISVLDKEIITIGLDKDTVFTKLITQKPWQEDTATTANAVRVGNFVVVHRPEKGFVANWVQVAVDFRVANNATVAGVVAPAGYPIEAVRHRAEAAALRAAPNASESKRPGSPGTAVHCDRMADRVERAAGFTAYGTPAANLATAAPVFQASASDILTGKEVRDLIANAKTPADHRKLAKHFEAVAARYEADATDHVAEAKAYRTAPSASESKRPGAPDTAAHCDRLADAARNAATAARELARDHEKMAK